MKTYMPLNGLRWSRNSGSANCDMPQSAVFGRPGGYLPERTVATETSNSVVPDGKRQLSDEKLAGVAGGRIPPLPEIPTTTTL